MLGNSGIPDPVLALSAVVVVPWFRAWPEGARRPPTATWSICRPSGHVHMHKIGVWELRRVGTIQRTFYPIFMQALHDIIQRLTPEERARFLEVHKSRSNTVSRIIADSLENPALTREEFIARHEITPATYNKSQSQAIDAIYRDLASTQSNPYDPILLIRLLLYRGLLKEARKQFARLEKEYIRQGLYSVLDVLYHEAVRICYQTGDTKWLAQLIEKINANSHDLLRYNELDSPLILQMLKLEKKGGESREAISVEELQDLRERAERLGHGILVHNSFYCLYVYYTQHDFNVEQAHWAAWNVLENARRKAASMNDYANMIAYNNYAHFLCIYSVDESPEPLFDRIAARIGMGGPLEVLDFYFHYLQYYITVGNTRKADGIVKRMAGLPQENRFSVLVNVAESWVAMAHRQPERFRQQFNAFYEAPAYQDFPEHEFHLRVMEIIFALREKEFEYAEGKMEALRKFHYRKFQPAEDYRVMVNALQRTIYACLQGNRVGKRAGEPTFSLRSMIYLHSLLRETVGS